MSGYEIFRFDEIETHGDFEQYFSDDDGGTRICYQAVGDAGLNVISSGNGGVKRFEIPSGDRVLLCGDIIHIPRTE